MRTSSLLIVIFVAGCAHHKEAPLVLNQHPSYEGKPGYLRCPAPAVATEKPCPTGALTAERTQARDYTVASGAGEASSQEAASEEPRPVDQLRPALPPMSKMQRIDRMRAVLAAIDAHVAGLDEQPSHEQRLVLKMSVKELRQLLATWPDVLPEADEMNQVVDQMETTMPIEQSRLRKRMNQLADLIRVQVVLAGE